MQASAHSVEARLQNAESGLDRELGIAGRLPGSQCFIRLLKVSSMSPPVPPNAEHTPTGVGGRQRRRAIS